MLFLKVAYDYQLPNGNTVESFSYFRQQDGLFEVPVYGVDEAGEEIDYTAKFKGIHYVGLGNTHFDNTKGCIAGLELLEQPHFVVKEEEIPKDLK